MLTDRNLGTFWFMLRPQQLADLVRRVGDDRAARLLSPGPVTPQALGIEDPPTAPLVDDGLNAAIGCKTSEVAMALLDQIVRLEQRDVATASDDQFETSFMNASAMLAELQPTTATEALLEWQHRCSVEKTPLLPTVGGWNRDVRYSAFPPILVRLHRGGSEFPLA